MQLEFNLDDKLETISEVLGVSEETFDKVTQ